MEKYSTLLLCDLYEYFPNAHINEYDDSAQDYFKINYPNISLDVGSWGPDFLDLLCVVNRPLSHEYDNLLMLKNYSYRTAYPLLEKFYLKLIRNTNEIEKIKSIYFK